jgi:hypothetical protein
LFVELEFSQPLSANGTASASTSYLTRDRRDMVKQIVEMDTLFEVIAPTVWDEAIVDDVDFSD